MINDATSAYLSEKFRMESGIGRQALAEYWRCGRIALRSSKIPSRDSRIGRRAASVDQGAHGASAMILGHAVGFAIFENLEVTRRPKAGKEL